MSRPTLYTFGFSVWAAAAEIAVAELGVDVESKQVNLMEGENFDPSFLELNPNATLPTLTSDTKTCTDTKSVVSFLNKDKKCQEASDFTDTLHEEKYDPNFALLLVRSDDELKAKAGSIPGMFLQNRQTALDKFSKDTKRFVEFYEEKKKQNGGLLQIYNGEVPGNVKDGFFEKSKSHIQNICDLILKEIPNKLPESGFIGGQQPGEDDFHLIAWLARIASTIQEATSIVSYDQELGESVPAKVVSYWNLWAKRPSFKIVYPQGKLH